MTANAKMMAHAEAAPGAARAAAATLVAQPQFGAVARRQASAADYLALAPLDHATKHVFILPGVFLALVLRPHVAPVAFGDLLIRVASGLASAILVSSANYVVNEWLDGEFDDFHPPKSGRAAKCRVEYLLSPPAFGALSTLYFSMSLRRDSPAQRPEKLFRARGLMLAVCATVGLLLALPAVDIPVLHSLTLPHSVEIGPISR